MDKFDSKSKMMKKIIGIFLALLPFSFCAKEKNSIVPKSKETKNMEIQNGLEVATLAGGCFWGLQELIRKQPGVVTTSVGYTGGFVENPTYQNHEGHAEAVEIEYDTEQTSYKNILDFFFKKYVNLPLSSFSNATIIITITVVITISTKKRRYKILAMFLLFVSFIAGVLTIGFIFGAYMTETFRGDVERGVYLGLGTGQWTSIVIFTTGVAIWVVGSRSTRKAVAALPA